MKTFKKRTSFILGIDYTVLYHICADLSTEIVEIDKSADSLPLVPDIHGRAGFFRKKGKTHRNFSVCFLSPCGLWVAPNAQFSQTFGDLAIVPLRGVGCDGRWGERVFATEAIVPLRGVGCDMRFFGFTHSSHMLLSPCGVWVATGLALTTAYPEKGLLSPCGVEEQC